MKWVVLVAFLLLLCQGFFSAWTDLGLYERQAVADAHRALLHAETDSLKAYVGDLFVRMDRLEVLAGL